MLHVASSEPQRKRGGWRLGATLSPAMKQTKVKIKPLVVKQVTQIFIACRDIFMSVRLVSVFQSRFQRATKSLYRVIRFHI